MTLLQIIINNDLTINTLLSGWRSEIATTIFSWVTLLGEKYFVAALTIIITAVLWRLNQKNKILALWLAVGGSAGTTYLAKLFFDRPRPINALILETSNSFPSGHATISIAFYGFLAYLLYKKTTNRLQRLIIILSTTILVLVIGFSRLYLGVHYFSDVGAGYLVGALWLFLATRLNISKTTC